MYIGVNVSICVYMYICIYVYMYISIYVYMYRCIDVIYTYILLWLRMFRTALQLAACSQRFFHGLLMTTVLEPPLPSGNLFKQWMSFAILASANASWCLTR